MLYSQLKIAYRSLWSNKLFTFINIVGLSIGMAVALLIFLWIQNEMRFDTYHPEADKIYRAVSHIDVGDEYWHWGTIPLSLCEKAAAEIPEIQQLSKARIARKPLFRLPDESLHEEKSMAYVDRNWFDLFSYQIVAGTLPSFFSDISSIALTEDLADQLFGTKEALGQIIRIDSIPYQVRLILEKNPTNTILQFQAYIPLEARWANEKQLQQDLEWGNYDYLAFIKGSDPASIANKLSSFLPIDEDKEEEENYISLVPLKEVRFNQLVDGDEFAHQKKSALYIFGFLGFIILLTAALNYISLSTALINRRIKEIGIKKVIGASFSHIFSQILAETLIMSLGAITFAAWIAEHNIGLLNSLIGIPLDINYASAPIWILMGSLILMSLLLAGIYPALLFAGFKPMRLLKKIHVPNKGLSMRKALVITQFGIAIGVLICTLILQRQMQFIQEKEVGYDRSYVIEFQPDLFRGNWRENYRLFGLWERELHKIPELEAVATLSGSLVDIGSFNGGDLHWEGKDPNFDAGVFRLGADENLQDLFNFEMFRGRWFSNDLETDQQHIILNEAAIKRYNIPEPVVGKPIVWKGQEGKVIGVVKDFHFQSLHHKIQPLLIYYESGFFPLIAGRTKGEHAQLAIRKAQKSFEEVLPHVVFKYNFLDDGFEQLHRTEADMSWLFRILSGLLIFISCLGLFGLSTFAVERRTKEIGIRKVLGARVHQIIQLVSVEFLLLVGIALLVASPIAWFAMDHWLGGFAYRISISWWLFALAGIIAIVLVFLTVGAQSFKAAIANPVEALRAE